VSLFERLQPQAWPRPRGYSNGLRVPAGHDLVFTAGMIGWDEAEQVVEGGFVAQFEQALLNVLAVVAEAGGGPEHVIRLTVFSTEREGYLTTQKELGEVWKRVMGRNYPVMALVQVKGLVETGALVEMEAVAAIPPSSTE
jgi:enamine deaminase RidA (YjgF/YER057c/UK114 family)